MRKFGCRRGPNVTRAAAQFSPTDLSAWLWAMAGASSELSLTVAQCVDRKLGSLADRYDQGDMLGEGRFSQVFAATRGKHSVALKAMELATLEEEEEARRHPHAPATPAPRAARRAPPAKDSAPAHLFRRRRSRR